MLYRNPVNNINLPYCELMNRAIINIAIKIHKFIFNEVFVLALICNKLNQINQTNEEKSPYYVVFIQLLVYYVY